MPGLFEQLGSHLGGDETSRSSSQVYEQLESHLEQEPRPDTTPVFERVKVEDEAAQLTPAHLIGMRGDRKKILLFLLRDPEANLQGVSLEVLQEKLPDIAPSLPALLTELAEEGWLIVMGEPPRLRYRIHMRRRPGGELGFGIWSLMGKQLKK
jgi:hypothetical protein